MMCDCYKIGGPWIAEDPDCPVHGTEAQREQRDREDRDAAVNERLAQLEAEVAELRKKVPN